METTTCGVVRAAAIFLGSAVMAIAVLIMARRHRRPAWLLPAFSGAILFGVSAGALLSLTGLLDMVRGIRVSGMVGLPAVAQGIWDANQIWRTGLYASLITAVVLVARYFLTGRGEEGEPIAPRTIAALGISFLPLLGSIISFAAFHRLNVALTFGSAQPSTLTADALIQLISSRAWLIGITSLITLLICLLALPLSFTFRKLQPPDRKVQLAAGSFLILLIVCLLVGTGILISFQRAMEQMGSGLKF